MGWKTAKKECPENNLKWTHGGHLARMALLNSLCSEGVEVAQVYKEKS